MKDENTKLLEQLAAKLGTTTEYLWGILIKQAPIDATVSLIQIIIVIICSVALFKYHLKLSKRIEDEYHTRYDESEMVSIIMGMLGVAMSIMLMRCLFELQSVINGYLNPEYWALDQIISSIKK